MNEFMEKAIALANKAKNKGEVPIGAVIVKNGRILSQGYNRREKTKNALHHAEIIAIDKACKKLKSWRLDECELYVTLEPCPMCAGAISNARIKKVYIAAQERSSNDGLCQQIFQSTRLNHKVEFEYMPDYEKVASHMLSDFFKTKR